MQIGIKNKHGNSLRLTEWNVTVDPEDVIWVDASEAQINRVKCTPNLEIIDEKR